MKWSYRSFMLFFRLSLSVPFTRFLVVLLLVEWANSLPAQRYARQENTWYFNILYIGDYFTSEFSKFGKFMKFTLNWGNCNSMRFLQGFWSLEESNTKPKQLGKPHVPPAPSIPTSICTAVTLTVMNSLHPPSVGKQTKQYKTYCISFTQSLVCPLHLYHRPVPLQIHHQW